MNTRIAFMATGVVTALLSLCGGKSASAQDYQAPLPPTDYNLDRNGVDLITGEMHFSGGPALSIGPPGVQGLTFYVKPSMEFQHNWITALNSDVADGGGPGFLFSNGAITDHLVSQDPTAQPVSILGTGAVLQSSMRYGVSTLAYTTREGTQYFVIPLALSHYYWRADLSRVGDILYPTGELTTIHHRSLMICPPGDVSGVCQPISRVQSITNNSGYQIKIEYLRDDPPASTLSSEDIASWQAVQKVTAINNTVEYCDPTADHCALSGAWPSMTFSQPNLITNPACTLGCYRTINDAMGRTWRYNYDTQGRLISVLSPTTGTNSLISIAYSAEGKVETVTNGVGTTTYTYNQPFGTTTITDAWGHQTLAEWNLPDAITRKIVSMKDPLGRTTRYQYDPKLRLVRMTAPEGNYTQFTYDDRNNLIETRAVSKTPGSPADIVSMAHFPETCANIVTCNKPEYTIDPKGSQTDYTYDSTSGLLLNKTLPAPTPGAVRPKITNTISALPARYLAAAGTYGDGPSLYRVTATSTCSTGAECLGTADELRATTQFGLADAPHNLLPTVQARSAGDGSVSSAVTTYYDSIGNPYLVDGPLAGSEDLTRIRYDGNRRVIGQVGPDPDGSDARESRAVRISYIDSPNGAIITQEIGSVSDPSDETEASFAAQETSTQVYDGFDRLSRSTVSAGGAPYQLQQYHYDIAGRRDCVATRMNPAAFGSLPDSAACGLGPEGDAGPDRITQYSYNSADELTSVSMAYGTSDQATVQAMTYTNNGRLHTVTDANGNLTTYEYDGVDRVTNTLYPDPATPGVSSSTDSLQVLSYDPNSNPTSVRLRNSAIVDLTRDALNRISIKNRPDTSDEDIYYAYDNWGRLLSARFGSATGAGVVNTYDGLGRLHTRTVFGRTLSYEYDPMGNRTQITHPDGFYATYHYNNASELTSIQDSTNATLAMYTYDNLGRRVGFGRGNGAGTGYGFDVIGRLGSLTQDMAGTAYDNVTTFNYSAASQLLGRTQSNDSLYAWTPSPEGVTFDQNGLNQITRAGSIAATYDAYGNLKTGEGDWTFAYDDENKLRTAASITSSVSLSYDPQGMLNQLVSSTESVTFLYDGADLVAEYSSDGAVLRRYVQGPGQDNPIAWYEGSGASDRRYLHADERGSIVAYSDDAGAGVASYTYSPDGEPSSFSGPRFKYTGQIAISEIGLYYYKARLYSPKLGRFLQPDPLGYADSLHLYAYVDGDPLNHTDPWGLADAPLTEVAVICNAACQLQEAMRSWADAFYLSYWESGLVTDELAGVERTPPREQAPQEGSCAGNPVIEWLVDRVSFGVGASAGFGVGASAAADFSAEEIGATGGIGLMQFGADVRAGVNIRLSGPGTDTGAFGQTQICAGFGLGGCFKFQFQNGFVSTELSLGAAAGLSFSNSLMYHQSLLGPAPLPASRCSKSH
jgi:RHS repeat-associated protein